MLRRTPMTRRNAPEARAAQREAEKAANLAALCTPARTLHTARMVRRVGVAHAVPKEAASQSPAYQRAAKALGYCMRCGRQVAPLTGELDFCHADIGKGQGLKTDARLGWPGCRECHETVGRQMAKAVRRAVEYLLGVMTRAAVREAGTWPKNLSEWSET